MTPAIRIVEQAGIPFTTRTYTHDPRTESYGEEAAIVLGVAPESVFKTLIIKVDGRELVVAMLPVNRNLDLKAAATAAGAKRAEMASLREAERTTGYVAGGISPLGQRKKLRTIIDESVLQLDQVYCSGGRRGLELILRPQDLIQLCRAEVACVTT